MANSQDIETYYDQHWRSPSWGSKEPNEDERLRAHAILKLIKKCVLPSFDPEQNLRILDLGCGKGWLTSILAGYGRVIGIDPVQASVTRAQELFPDLDFRVGAAKDLLSKSGPEQFQLIISSEVIEHIVDRDKENFMKSVYSLLVPAGFAVFTTPRGELWETWKRAYPTSQPIEQWISESDLEQLSRSASFRIVARDRVFLPSNPYSLMSHIATSKPLRLLMPYFPRSKLFAKLRYYCGIYQVILLQTRRQ